VQTILLLLYAVAGGAYAVHFARRDRASGHLSTTMLGIAVLAHTFAIGMQTMALGHLPLAGTSQAVSTFVWLLAVSYLYAEMTTGERAMGAFIVPLLVALQAVPVLAPVAANRTPILDSPLFGIHVSSLLFAYASFALACVVGITYVLLFNEIKAKHLGFFYSRLPSLEVLDRMNARAVLVGWCFLTVGVAVGAVWAFQAQGAPVPDPRVAAMSWQDPKILAALLSWSIYSFALWARRSAGWGGRRSAYLSAAGFAMVLLNLLPVSYFLTRSHNF
jgi:ABC-type transport system involved in cytochrome c biogenesis permease subunit